MKRYVPLMAVIALPLAATAAARDLNAADFAWHATLVAEHGEGLHQLQLGQEPLRAAATPGPSDLRIFNANGEALPVAHLPALAPAAAEHGPPVALRMAPLPSSPQAQDRALAEYALRLTRDRDRTVLEVGADRGVAVAEKQAARGGYVLDTRPLKDMQGELSLHFAADAPDYANTATISGSDDLVSWHPLTSGPLVRNRQLGDSAVERSSFDMDRPPAFVRVLWPAGPAPMLDGASFRERLLAPVAPAPRAPLEIAAVADGQWLIDLPVGLPLTRVMIHVPQPNQALRVDLLCPQSGDALPDRRHLLLELTNRNLAQPWRVCAHGIEAFRIDRAGRWVENEPVGIPGRPEHLVLQVIDPRNYRGPPPSVEGEWLPVRLAFLARGPGHYQLAVGHEGADEGPRLDLSGMLPRDDFDGSHLPVARVVQVAAVDSTQAAARAEQSVRNLARWRAFLWALLLLAVALLAVLAWRLARSMGGAGR